MYRLATLLALLIALVAGGCGGSGDEDPDSAPSAVAQARESTGLSDDTSRSADAESAKKKKKSNDGAEKASEGEAEDDESESHDDAHEDHGEALTELPRKRRRAVIEAVVRSAVLRFGLELVDVRLRDGGRKVTAIVARKGACNFVAKQESNLVVTIQHGAPGVKNVRFQVAGTGQELGYYVLGCKKPEIPSGAGRVVLEHSAVGGPYTSKRFKITSARWALEWVNEAASLAVIIVPVGGESKDEHFKPVGSQKRESGRYNYTGPGTFQIKAHGAGGWRIRVKEIR